VTGAADRPSGRRPASDRVRMTGKERREQLLDVGRKLFAEKGFESVSVEEIAAKAGVSKPVVYEHFGGKEGLYAVVVDREMNRLLGMTVVQLTTIGHRTGQLRTTMLTAPIAKDGMIVTPPRASAIKSLITPPTHSSGSPRKEFASILRCGSNCSTAVPSPRSATNSAPFLLRETAPPVLVSR